jgi:hypothetical protein
VFIANKSPFFYYNWGVEKIQFLYIDECPNSEEAWNELVSVLHNLNVHCEIEKILINDDLEADFYSFQGSPSIKVDGHDLWEVKSDEYHLGCRVYPTKFGLRGRPELVELTNRLRSFTDKTENLETYK